MRVFTTVNETDEKQNAAFTKEAPVNSPPEKQPEDETGAEKAMVDFFRFIGRFFTTCWKMIWKPYIFITESGKTPATVMKPQAFMLTMLAIFLAFAMYFPIFSEPTLKVEVAPAANAFVDNYLSGKMFQTTLGGYVIIIACVLIPVLINNLLFCKGDTTNYKRSMSWTCSLIASLLLFGLLRYWVSMGFVKLFSNFQIGNELTNTRLVNVRVPDLLGGVFVVSYIAMGYFTVKKAGIGAAFGFVFLTIVLLTAALFADKANAAKQKQSVSFNAVSVPPQNIQPAVLPPNPPPAQQATVLPVVSDSTKKVAVVVAPKKNDILHLEATDNSILINMINGANSDFEFEAHRYKGGMWLSLNFLVQNMSRQAVDVIKENDVAINLELEGIPTMNFQLGKNDQDVISAGDHIVLHAQHWIAGKDLLAIKKAFRQHRESEKIAWVKIFLKPQGGSAFAANHQAKYNIFYH
ncbi:MAG: hypothetical protein QM726_04170 [Chitinophagaceae bacterium]